MAVLVSQGGKVRSEKRDAAVGVGGNHRTMNKQQHATASPLPAHQHIYIHTYIRPAKDRNGNVPACPKGPFTSETREGRESKVSCFTSDSPPISQLRGDSIYFCHASEKSIQARIICYCSNLTPTPFPPIYALLLTLLWHFSLSPWANRLYVQCWIQKWFQSAPTKKRLTKK